MGGDHAAPKWNWLAPPARTAGILPASKEVRTTRSAGTTKLRTCPEKPQNMRQSLVPRDVVTATPAWKIILSSLSLHPPSRPRCAPVAPKSNPRPGALKNAPQSWQCWQPWQPYPKSPAKSPVPKRFQGCSLGNLGNLARHRPPAIRLYFPLLQQRVTPAALAAIDGPTHWTTSIHDM